MLIIIKDEETGKNVEDHLYKNMIPYITLSKGTRPKEGSNVIMIVIGFSDEDPMKDVRQWLSEQNSVELK